VRGRTCQGNPGGAAFDRWQGVTLSVISFTPGADLPLDINATGIPFTNAAHWANFWRKSGDSRSPVIYDVDGTIILAAWLRTRGERDGFVFTGTNNDGTGTGGHCNNWTSLATNIFLGKNELVSAWSNALISGGCINALRLYCFEE
jgi:hypothetical protein